ncbi:hypothetical protein GEMRC1_002218 [Eukaryota sp. GEM-RC1]
MDHKLKHSSVINAFCFCIRTDSRCSWCNENTSFKTKFVLEINPSEESSRFSPYSLQLLLDSHLPVRKYVECSNPYCSDPKSEITETLASLPKVLIIRLTGPQQPVDISLEISVYQLLSPEVQLKKEIIEISPFTDINSRLHCDDIFSLSHRPKPEECSVFDISNESERLCGSKSFGAGRDWERKSFQRHHSVVTRTNDPLYTYKLFSAICCHGFQTNSHFVTYTKVVDGSWFLHDTNNVSKQIVDERTALTDISSTGYVLYYQHSSL